MCVTRGCLLATPGVTISCRFLLESFMVGLRILVGSGELHDDLSAVLPPTRRSFLCLAAMGYRDFVVAVESAQRVYSLGRRIPFGVRDPLLLCQVFVDFVGRLGRPIFVKQRRVLLPVIAVPDPPH